MPFRRLLLGAMLAAVGCGIGLTKQRYSSPSAPGAVGLMPSAAPFVGDGQHGTTRWASPTAARLAIGDGHTLEVFACNLWERGYVLLVLPPLPFWLTQATPDRLVVGISPHGRGPWRFDVRGIVLDGPPGNAHVERVATSPRQGLRANDDGAVEPCDWKREVDLPVPDHPMAVADGSTLWLVFDRPGDPATSWTLHLGNATLDKAPVVVPPIALRPGSRGYTFIFAP